MNRYLGGLVMLMTFSFWLGTTKPFDWMMMNMVMPHLRIVGLLLFAFGAAMFFSSKGKPQ